nr:putative copia-like polyprotein [Tanacetum cinerariifolium]GEZ10627.1 putative copia-like polyprotein [Tanacetum cinerariifolium]
MMKRIVENTHGHLLKDQKFSKMDKVPLCTSFSLGKLIVRPSLLKIKNESLMFIERIQVKRVRLDNAREFTSHAFNDYCMFVGIVVEHLAIFPPLGGEKKTHEIDVSWNEPSLLYLDPHTKQSETEVQKIMHLQEITNQLPDAFTNTKRVTKSHIPAANAPARVKLPNKQAGNNIAQESQKRLKRERPIGSKDKNPRKRKGTKKNSDHDKSVLDETQDIKTSPEEEMNDMNKEMSINYSQTNILWDRNEIGDINEIFSYSVASDIMSGDDDPEPKSVIDCQNRPD